MTGEELHKRLKTIRLNGHKIVLTSLAEKLEMRRQDLNSKFKAQKIDYGFIIQVANALQIDVSEITGTDKQTTTVEEPSTLYMKRQTPKDFKDMLIESQQEQIRLHKKVERLQDELIHTLKEKKE